MIPAKIKDHEKRREMYTIWVIQTKREIEICHCVSLEGLSGWPNTLDFFDIGGSGGIIYYRLYLSQIEWDLTNGPRSVSCDRAIRYSGFFGVRETWVLLEISWIIVTPFQVMPALIIDAIGSHVLPTSTPLWSSAAP